MSRSLTIDEIMAIVVSARRHNLRKWIDDHFDGQQARFISETEINQGELSGLLKNKAFGEKKARAIELKCGMGYLFLDQVFPGAIVNNSPQDPVVSDLSQLPPSVANVWRVKIHAAAEVFKAEMAAGEIENKISGDPPSKERRFG